MTLHQKIAKTLGWSIKDTKTFDLPTLRELVRPFNRSLAEEVSQVIKEGSHLTEKPCPTKTS